MEINGITLELSGKTFKVEGRGVAYTATLEGDYTHSQVSTALMGQEFKGQKIIGIEMFAIERQNNAPISILVPR